MMQRYQCRRAALLLLLLLLCNDFFTSCNNIFVCAKEVSTTTAAAAATTTTASTKRVKGRKLNDSIYQWRQFEQALAEERKKDSDSKDSFKHCEKMREKHGITCTPSAQPSSAPSVAPSISMSPSLSNVPSVAPSSIPSTLPSKVPSQAPSRIPSSQPSQGPTNQPSVTPSSGPSSEPSKLPTIAPTTPPPTPLPFESLLLTREDGSQWQDNTCQTALPAGATQLQTEETRFEYYLYLKTDADPDINVKQVEHSLATAMAGDILTCTFDGSTQYAFETYGITSLPVDTHSDNCPDAALMDGSDCYVITGGFTPTIFYLDDQGGGRQLQLQLQLVQRERERERRTLTVDRAFSSQSESEIVGVFGPILQSLLDSNTFVSGDIVKTTYSGFLLGDSPGSGSGSTGTLGGIPPSFDTTTTVALQGQSPSSQGDGGRGGGGPQTGFVIGAVAICLAVIALIVVSAVLIQRRSDAARKQDFESVDGQQQLDDLEVEIDTEALPDKYDTRSVLQDGGLQEGFPGDNTSYISNNNNNMPGIEDIDSVYSKSAYSSGRFGQSAAQDESSVDEARRAVSGLKYSVVNDEATFDESLFDLDSSAGKDPHDYANCKSATCFKCRSRNMKKPTFVQADLQAIQSDLGSNKKYRPKYNRKYVADDTVNL